MALHFDGKHINGCKHQVVLVKNKEMEFKLAALVLKSGKAKDIFERIKIVLDDFQIWSNVKLIIAGTKNTNTGYKNVVVSLLQKACINLGFQPPQFIGCHHHVLDLLLKHVTNSVLTENAKFPTTNAMS